MIVFWMMYDDIYVLCEVAIVSQLFIPFLFTTWDCVKMTLLAGSSSPSGFFSLPGFFRSLMVIPDLPELVIGLKKCNKGFLKLRRKLLKWKVRCSDQ